MHSPFSVIVFTVLAGAGLGALAVTALFDAATTAQALDVLLPSLARIVVASIALIVVGLGASTLHLAKPRNAWRSLARWRTSWLSREALLAFILLPLAALYALALQRSPAAPRLALAATVVALAWGLLVCTAMIYASLRPIRQWHTLRVPLAYVLMGHASGALLVLAMLPRDAPGVRGLAVVALLLLAAAFVAKLEYWQYLRRGTGALTLERAIGVAQGVRPAGPASRMAARLLDVGHSRGTFLTREFIVPASPGRVMVLRAIALIAGFVLPALVVSLDGGLAAFAFGACMIGLLAERWLFFAEARHTVRLYHGEAST
jgi:DMSO reductase anchor subunit